LDSGNDVCNGQLVAIKEIPATNPGMGGDHLAEGEEYFVILGFIFCIFP